MHSHQRNHTAVIRWMLIVCLLYSGSSLEAQIEAQTPVLTQDAPSKSKETSDDSELKIQNYQLKHAKAVEVLKLFKQLHGVENAATIDDRTNSIVFLANETNARELRESLALLDGDAPHPIIPPTPVVQGSSPKVPSPAKSKPAGPFRKFTFKHAKVADVVKILRELTGANIDNRDMEGFAVDERTNSVIWKIEDEWSSQQWEEMLLTLDGESSASRIQSAPSAYAAPASMPTPIDFATLNSQVSAQPTQTFTFSMGFERGESVEALKQRYNELEKQTHQLADKLKQSKSPSEPERTELETAVRKSFEARQALQRAELADLAQRIQSMQQSIDMRDKLADKVIERRVEDLLNPSLKWESIQPSELLPTTAGEVDLSTPQATLNTIHRYSVDHPMGVPVECYTEAALQELSGVMLQQLCFMSGLSQVGLQTGGVIGVKDNAPIVAGTAPSFHLSVDALLKEHSLPTPPEECTKAFELLAKLTLGAAFGNGESRVKPDRELFRLAAGILKSPKEFLPKAGELSERFNNIPGDTESPKKESKAQPKYLIKIDGDEATATLIVDSDKPSVPMSFKLQRINQRWLVCEAFSDEILNQMISSMSQVLGAMSAIESEVANQRDSSDSKKAPDADKPLYSGHPISWWLDSYWDNATASPKTTENAAQEYVASEAIRQLRGKPECKAAIENALAKWFASVEHEVNEIQLIRAAKCIVTAAGPEYQELAVDYLCKIWSQLPTLTLEMQIELTSKETELNDLLQQLVLDDELANKFAERLTNGSSSDRSLVTYYLFSCTGLKDDKDPKVAELNTWLHNHRELFFPAFTAALKDESEQVRWFSLGSLVGLDKKLISLPSTLTMVVESDASPLVRGLAIGMFSTKEMLAQVKSQNIEIAPLMIKTLEHDSSIDVRNAALQALMAMDTESELVHATLLRWARCKERVQVEYALTLMLRNHEAGDRPQSIDELIELLSDPEWGTAVEINYNNWSTHHRWARQYALAILGEYSAHAHRAIPTLEAELARNNKDTHSFATKALDRVRGYCPDRPIDKLQGDWEFVSMEKPEGSTPFFDLQASSDQQPASVITIRGTQLKLGDRALAEISHPRLSNGVALLLDPNDKKRHCNGRHDFNLEYLISSSSKLEWMKLEIRELLDDRQANEESKQTYEFRPLKNESQ